MIGALKCLKVAKCYLFLEGVLTGFSSKELKEVTSLVAVKQIHQINYKENIKHCVYKKAACLGTSPHGLQTFRCFSSASDNRDIVKHDHIKQLFYVDVGDGSVGYIEYDKKEQLIVMKHTFVSKGLGGRGIGKLLAKEALEYVAKHDLQLEIQCPFIREYVCKYEPKYIKYIQK